MHHQVLIVGGGTAGITVAARLRRARRGLDVAVLEPDASHYYQPLWTLVGAGVVAKEASRRDEADLIPSGATWIRDRAERFEPEHNRVVTGRGDEIGYDWLVVCPGIQLNWDAVKGLRRRSAATVSAATTRTTSARRPGRRCAASRAARRSSPCRRRRSSARARRRRSCTSPTASSGARACATRPKIIYAPATASIFAVKEYAATLDRVCERKGIERHFKYNLVELRPAAARGAFRAHRDARREDASATT